MNGRPSLTRSLKSAPAASRIAMTSHTFGNLKTPTETFRGGTKLSIKSILLVVFSLIANVSVYGQDSPYVEAINAQTQAIKDSDFNAQLAADNSYRLQLMQMVMAQQANQPRESCQFVQVITPAGQPAYYELKGCQPLGPIYIKKCQGDSK
jgi:hypothetical protein